MNKQASVDAVRHASAEFDGELLDLLVGQPYYGPPAELAEALVAAAREGSGEYGPPAGLPGLRKKLCDIERESGFAVGPESIVVGNGSKGLLFGVLSVLSGETVIVPTPAYPANLAQPALLGKHAIQLPLDPPFRLRAEDLDRIVEPSGILALSSPSNPAGVSVELSQWPQILERCHKKGMRIIVDEVYRDLRFAGEAPNWGEIDPDLESVIIVRSFSKSHGVCGWRLGYVMANAEAATKLSKWQSMALNPPSTPVQRAFEAWLPGENSRLGNIVDHYRECARTLSEVLSAVGFVPVMPDGGLYIFADAKTIANGKSSEDLCIRLARNGVLLWPGEDFGAPGYVRLAFASVSPERFDQTLDQLRGRLEAGING